MASNLLLSGRLLSIIQKMEKYAVQLSLSVVTPTSLTGILARAAQCHPGLNTHTQIANYFDLVLKKIDNRGSCCITFFTLSHRWTWATTCYCLRCNNYDNRHYSPNCFPLRWNVHWSSVSRLKCFD